MAGQSLSIVKQEPLTITGVEPATQEKPAEQPGYLQQVASRFLEGISHVTQSLKDYAGEATQSVNPVTIVSGVNQAASHPVATGQAVLKAQGDLATKAHDAFSRGDYAESLRHSINYLLPIIGPRLDQAGDYGREGQYAKMLGATTDVAVQTMGPKIAQNTIAGRTIVPAVAANRNAAEAGALEAAQKANVPVSAGAATGNRFVRGVQELSDTSPVGSFIAEKAKAAEGRGLATMGEQLAAKGSPASFTPEQAGQGVRDALQAKIQDFDAKADTAYGRLRQIAAQNPRTVAATQQGAQQAMEMPVDLRRVRPSLEPIYQQLKRESELVPLMGDKARALTALDRLLHGPAGSAAQDFAPLEIVDKALGDLKAMSRGNGGLPELRTQGQGVAAAAVKSLDAEVRRTAAQYGPDAVRALEDGRSATTTKYAIANVYDAIKNEPVRAFSQTTAPRDSAVAQLRDIARYAPDELPKIGRAWLDSWLDKATEGGGFQHADRLLVEWHKLGPETKKLLFSDPAYIADLDRFFLAAKTLARVENTSRTALVAHSGGQMALLITNPAAGVPTVLGSGMVSALLHSRAGVRLLTKGLQIPAGNKFAVTAYGAELSRAIEESGLSQSALPATAGTAQTEGRRQ